MKRLALLVPARNAAGVLGRLLDSADRQTSAFDEVLVYDDASSDGTADFARARGARVIRSERNTGPSEGKNVLARATTCDWVHFHDADEALTSEFVRIARGWMPRADVDVIVFGTEDRSDETGARLGGRVWDCDALRVDPVRYALLNCITNCGVYRRDRFLEAGGFDTDESVKYNEDQAMHLRLALAGLAFESDPYVGVIVYRRRHSMSADHQVECAAAHVEVLHRVARLTGARYRGEIASELWRMTGVCAAYSDWPTVRKCLTLASQPGSAPVGEHWAVRTMARISPFGAVAVREALIRAFKPHLRSGMPRAGKSPRAAFAASTPRHSTP